jgi:hypothetical protein
VNKRFWSYTDKTLQLPLQKKKNEGDNQLNHNFCKQSNSNQGFKQKQRGTRKKEKFKVKEKNLAHSLLVIPLHIGIWNCPRDVL